MIYVSDSLIHHGGSPVTFTRDAQGDTINFEPRNLLWLAVLSLFFGLVMVAYVQWDGTRLFRKLGLTERTSRNSIWNDTFQDVRQTVDPALGSIVQVELRDGRSVMGVVDFYSDTAKECSVFLRSARWIDPNSGGIVEVDGPGILLTHNSEITSVSFLNPK